MGKIIMESYGECKCFYYETDFFDEVLLKMGSKGKKGPKGSYSSDRHFSVGREIILLTGEKKQEDYIIVLPEKLSSRGKSFFYWETISVHIISHTKLEWGCLLVNFSTSGTTVLLLKENVIPESIFSNPIFVYVRGNTPFREEVSYRFVITPERLHIEKGEWNRLHLWEKSGGDYFLTIDESNELEKILLDFKKLLPRIKAYDEKSFQRMMKENTKRRKEGEREREEINLVR